jgi:hypothetical protein
MAKSGLTPRVSLGGKVYVGGQGNGQGRSGGGPAGNRSGKGPRSGGKAGTPQNAG